MLTKMIRTNFPLLSLLPQLEHLNSGIEDMQSALKPWIMRSALCISRGKSSAEISLNDKVDATFSPALLYSLGDAHAFVKKIISSTSSKQERRRFAARCKIRVAQGTIGKKKAVDRCITL